MSFQSMDQLTNDQLFMARVRACCAQNAGTLTEATPPDQLALGVDCQKGGTCYLSMVSIIACFPGLADGATDDKGDVDQTLIDDPTILSQTQTNWAHVAKLWFEADGTRRP
jgi:hypothetical protein